MHITRPLTTLFLLLSLFVLSSCDGNLTSTHAKIQTIPRFEQGSCPFSVGPDTLTRRTVQCGYLVVPEDRSQPGNHHTIHLAVAIFKSPGTSSVSDPLLFLQGGPGAALVEMFGPRPEHLPFSAFAQASNRDVILLDQRGSGLSQPALTCPELAAVAWFPVIQYHTLDSTNTMDDKLAQQARAEQQCRDRLLHQGVHPAVYTVSADAEDVSDLRQALGYKTWNIFAVSYGTRVAQAVMRIDSAGLRSVVLDSVLPEQSTGPFDIMGSTQQALDTVFQECAHDPSCTAQYPHPLTVFLQLVNQLNAHPVEIPKIDGAGNISSPAKNYLERANGETLIDIVFSLLQIAHIHMILPQMLYQLQMGNTTLLAQVYAQAVAQPLHLSQGVFFSMVCSDDAPYTNKQQIQIQAQTLLPVLRPIFQNQLNNLWSNCQEWHVSNGTASQKIQLKSTIPTLILSGEHDPLTSWNNVTLIRQGLSRSFAVQFPDTGHGVLDGTPCSSSVIATFLDHLQQPDTSCIHNQ